MVVTVLVWDGADVASVYRNIASFGNDGSNYAGDHAVKNDMITIHTML